MTPFFYSIHKHLTYQALTSKAQNLIDVVDQIIKPSSYEEAVNIHAWHEACLKNLFL